MNRKQNKSDTRTIVYYETTCNDPRYKLEVVTFQNDPETYWCYVFREEYREHLDFWICVNTGSYRIKPGNISAETFCHIPPPSFNSREEAISFGKSILNHYAKDKITFDDWIQKAREEAEESYRYGKP